MLRFSGLALALAIALNAYVRADEVRLAPGESLSAGQSRPSNPTGRFSVDYAGGNGNLVWLYGERVIWASQPQRV